MSDIRSLPRFTFNDIENYIKYNLHKACGGAAEDHMKNSIVNEKSFALYPEKSHILRIIINTDDATADFPSTVKHKMAKHNICCVKTNFTDIINMSGKCSFTIFSDQYIE